MIQSGSKFSMFLNFQNTKFFSLWLRRFSQRIFIHMRVLISAWNLTFFLAGGSMEYVYLRQLPILLKWFIAFRAFWQSIFKTILNIFFIEILIIAINKTFWVFFFKSRFQQGINSKFAFCKNLIYARTTSFGTCVRFD